MSRRRYLIAYDICEPKRLRRVCKIMEEYGERMQYSVFLCDLSKVELIHARRKVTTEMDLAEDSVLIADLGDQQSGCLEFVGRRRPLPTSGPRIV